MTVPPAAATSGEAATATTPLVSVVIPSIGSAGSVFGARRTFVVEAVRSVLATAGVPVEVIVVAGREMPAAVVDELLAMPGDAVRIVEFDAPFNFSASVNLGVAHARGERVLLLNDDVEVVSPGWLTAMLDALDSDDGIGAVGARLLFEDGTLQHAGHTYRTALGHVGFGLAGDAVGRGGILGRRRPVAGVTAACLLVPFGVYDLVGGLCTDLPGNYNDVDLCLKIRALGLTILYEPAAVLHHFESRSRVPTIRPEELAFIDARWRSRIATDPFTPAHV